MCQGVIWYQLDNSHHTDATDEVGHLHSLGVPQCQAKVDQGLNGYEMRMEPFIDEQVNRMAVEARWMLNISA